ncbi:MAG: aminoglycoside phosphotransferase, partial [Acidimicrobiales bacterium]
FLTAYGGVGDDLAARARGWAVLFSLMLIGIGRAERPSYAAAGQAALRTVSETARPARQGRHGG